MAILEHINKKEEEPIAIFDYLDKQLISFLETTTQRETLISLVDLLDKERKLEDKKAFFQAILQREKVVSTGIGIGVAIPHAKLKGYDDFFIAIGILKTGIPWQALDGLPVKIIFMIGGPEDQQTEYLTILSMITTAIKDENRRKDLLKANNAEEVVGIFRE